MPYNHPIPNLKFTYKSTLLTKLLGILKEYQGGAV
jgi:hypothetical protein